MDWKPVISEISPYIVKIETPEGSGSGFLYVHNKNKIICGIATARHVISRAHEWQQPIKIIHNETGTTKLLNEPDRFIFSNPTTDSAVILFKQGDFPFPKTLIPLLPTTTPIDIGNEVCWLGFPGIDPFTLCFFSGNISARKKRQKAYLIDGVAVNGVSGGPVLYATKSKGIQIVGIITAYQANWQRGDALPGLSIAQDVSHFHDVVKQINTLDEASNKEIDIGKEEMEN